MIYMGYEFGNNCRKKNLILFFNLGYVLFYCNVIVIIVIGF